MATKLSKTQIEKINALNLGFTAKTEEQAEEQLLGWLEAHGLPGMEQETIDNLIDIVGSMASIAEEEEEAAAPAETQADEPKKAAKKGNVDTKKKHEKAAKKTVPNKHGVRLVPQKKKEDLAKLKELLGDLFPMDKYEYVPVSRGISIKYRGANSKQVAIMFENVYLKDGKPSTTNVVLNAFRSQTLQDKLADSGVEFGLTWNALPLFKGIEWEDAIALVNDCMNDICQVVSNVDNRLGRNRAKMEQSLKAAAPASKKAPAAKKEAPAPKAEEPKADPKAAARAALVKAAAAKKAKAAKK